MAEMATADVTLRIIIRYRFMCCYYYNIKMAVLSISEVLIYLSHASVEKSFAWHESDARTRIPTWFGLGIGIEDVSKMETHKI